MSRHSEYKRFRRLRSEIELFEDLGGVTIEPNEEEKQVGFQNWKEDLFEDRITGEDEFLEEPKRELF